MERKEKENKLKQIQKNARKINSNKCIYRKININKEN